MEIRKSFDNFCGAPFWDLNTTWNNDHPDFTPCFEMTILTWIPCAFLWIFLPLEVYYFRHSKLIRIPFNIYNTVKLVLIALMSTLVLIDSIYYSIQSQLVPALVASSLIKSFTYVLFLGFTYGNMKYGIRSSGVLFFFSFLLVICGAPKYRTDIINRHNLDVLPLITYLLYYPTTITVFILNCFSDAPPETAKSLHLESPLFKNVCPENQSSFLSRLLFAWFDSLAWKGYRKPLTYDDLWSLDYENTSAAIVGRFEKYWLPILNKLKSIPDVQVQVHRETEGELLKASGETIDAIEYQTTKSNEPVSVLSALIHTFKMPFLFVCLLQGLQSILLFVSPQILSLLIDFVQGNDPMWRGYLFAFLLLATNFIQTLVVSQCLYRTSKIGMGIRTALIALIYKKSLTISNGAKKNYFNTGQIVNLMSIDVQRIADFMGLAFINMLWSAPLEAAAALFFLWQYLGPSVLAGLAVLAIMMPLNGWIVAKLKGLQMKNIKRKDDRSKLMNEILSGIKVLKLYAWEPSFEKEILQIRNKEIKLLMREAYWYTAGILLWFSGPFLVALVTFGVFVLSSDKNILDAKTAFVSLSLFNILRAPLIRFPITIPTLLQANISLTRVNAFLNAEDLNPSAVSHKKESAPLSIENGYFSWEKTKIYPAVLQNINLNINSGSLVAVVGPVGSGKSSLLSAFLGEIFKLKGSVNTFGTIAHVPQQAWIQNATFRDNVTFGEQAKDITYNEVLFACALNTDLEMLPAGDMTEIGEKGINLSGGQKQRVSLARAVYFDADIYLLDDPLSAVDSHVGKHIFENVIGPKGLLNHKCDHIVVLKDGLISESGTFKELTDRKGDFAEFLLTYLKENTEEPDEEVQARNNESDSVRLLNRQKSTETGDAQNLKRTSGTVGKKLIEAEHAESGSVKWQVYTYYLASVGVFLSITAIIMNGTYQAVSKGSSVWLSKWTSDNSTVVNGTQDTSKRDLYLGVYAALGLSQGVMLTLSCLAQAYGVIGAAKCLHNSMLTHTLRAPLRFFETTPVGRILNRFAKDVETVDSKLPQSIRVWLVYFLEVVSILVIISYSTPVFLIIIIPIGAFYFYVQRFYVATSRQLTRLQSNSKSPIFSHFSETIAGAPSIRAYGLQKKFILQSENKVDFNQKCHYPNLVSGRWMSVRLETVGNLIIFFAALFAVLQRGNLSPGVVGLSISYALQITLSMNWAVRMTSELEGNIVAVERIKEYGETPEEAAWEIDNHKVPDKWPEKGEIQFDDFCVRYREGLELVLKGLTFHVDGGEKVGVVGRTGAGKSSLTLSLLRIIESAGGSISIDGIDISTLGLHTLRSRITIIPQDPVLFSGTLRMNLDPAGLYSDEAVWSALELAHLKTYIVSLNSAGLQCEVNEGGQNFSVGQRQLICLARALLRKTKVLILDEATAAIDLETDDLIQTTIRNEFKECTVLTIAHRLNTILDYDKIMVLEKGVLAEYDTPTALLESRNSIFYGMVADAGLQRRSSSS